MIFNDDQLAIKNLARRFAREKLLPQYQARDKSGVLDRALIREMGELGLMGVDLPESFGGLGAPGVTAGIIAEELAYGDFNVSAVPVSVSLLGAIGMMYLLGFSLDNLSLMALTVATGFVVDDAIVVLENISRHIEGGMSLSLIHI